MVGAQVARSLEKKVHELLEASVLLVKDGNTQPGRAGSMLSISTDSTQEAIETWTLYVRDMCYCSVTATYSACTIPGSGQAASW